ncbi:MAG: DNA (cytosine-5-)-methyltransferase [Alteromonadaceae bacterium]|nr:DNA (cytosine-5-)-methyltransferase [Alteromonadaceae bacterium]MAX42549.1 DNA (cytosine-5-)-methyltransferase [Alteromonadaceae bacterium]MBL52431.1 DNA (cytosine-5-)-methyltransferase [Alteromonadaceae bacterium]|tara:strand:+ start:42703 stop:44061 length:1359 start_codon:yes stop_codon:yes gene_type:complete
MTDKSDLELIHQLLEIYDQKAIAEFLNKVSPDRWCRETLNRWLKGKATPKLTHSEYLTLKELIPTPKVTEENCEFRFIDLFAGIGGIRKGFEDAGGLCVLTSEWNKYAVKTYKANHGSDESIHKFNEDIRQITLSEDESISDEEAYKNIEREIPEYDVLLAGFPCQPFSIAGVSKKNAMGREHGFECKTQGTLFFDVARIIAATKPKAFVLENVKNLKSHDKGKTFRVIMETLKELGYEVADEVYEGTQDPKIIDGKHFLPQHRERIVLVGFRKDLNVHENFSLKDVLQHKPEQSVTLGQILDRDVDEKYILTPKLWQYLYDYAAKHKAKGNGFGFGLVNENSVARTLSARYYKDGSEILVDRGWDFEKGFDDPKNLERRPRRLTPLECARLMGFSTPGSNDFKIPVSDTQAYKQFGNSVVVPVFTAVAKLMKPRILQAIIKDSQKKVDDAA